MLPTLPNVFRVSFSETTLCLALLSPLVCLSSVHLGDRTALQGGPVGSDHSSQSDFILARSVFPAVACYCPWLSVRLHVSFSSLQRLKCIPKPTAKPRASASLLGPCSEQSLYWLSQKIAPLLHGLSSN